FFTSNLHQLGDWTPNHGATQKWGDVGWNVVCRLREQLLMHLISAASTHVARPGIVQLFAAP
ncbi:hypothetical protein, partial [Dyella ginsengisoli]|uniref:hypothetical protein n=1 Tax=Dyella ginsengisoli TaxID=363848 RepID=UPI0019D6CAF9